MAPDGFKVVTTDFFFREGLGSIHGVWVRIWWEEIVYWADDGIVILSRKYCWEGWLAEFDNRGSRIWLKLWRIFSGTKRWSEPPVLIPMGFLNHTMTYCTDLLIIICRN